MTENRVPSHRPLGVSLAIVLAGSLFGLIPGLNLAMLLFVQARLSNIANTEVTLPDGSVMTVMSSGGYENLINPAAFIVQACVCLWVFAVCIMAWRGKPKGIRWVFTATVLILASITAYVTLGALWGRPDLSAGVSSADAVDGFEWANAIFASVLLPLYTVWYMNRAPARAFFRG